MRVEIGGQECRVIFQGINNRDATEMEKILDTLGKEAPHKVLLPLSPFEHDEDDLTIPTTTYHSAEQIDNALINRYKGRKVFKVGAE